MFAFQSWRPSSAQRLWHVPFSALSPTTGSHSSVFCALVQERSFTIAVDTEGWGLVEGLRLHSHPIRRCIGSRQGCAAIGVRGVRVSHAINVTEPIVWRPVV